MRLHNQKDDHDDVKVIPVAMPPRPPTPPFRPKEEPSVIPPDPLHQPRAPRLDHAEAHDEKPQPVSDVMLRLPYEWLMLIR